MRVRKDRRAAAARHGVSALLLAGLLMVFGGARSEAQSTAHDRAFWSGLRSAGFRLPQSESALPLALEAASLEGVVTTVVVDGVVVVVAGGVVVVVVVVSSFLLQAANETAAARVTINSAVFMFLLDIKVRLTGLCGNLLAKCPIVRKTWSARAAPVPSRRL